MVEYDLPKEHFIGGWYIDETLCDQIITKYNNDDTVHPYDPPRQFSWVDLGEFDNDLCESYCGELIKVLDEYKSKFNLCYEQLQPWGFTRPRLQSYKPGDSYHVSHCENDGHPGTIQRHLAFMTYLSSIDNGGGTEFVQQELVTPSIAGLTVIWPAGWTHYHRGITAPDDTKYIVTGWCCF